MIDLQVIKAKLETQTCPEHHQHPEVTVVPEGVSIAACCQPFHEAMNAMLEQEIEASINAAFASAFGQLPS